MTCRAAGDPTEPIPAYYSSLGITFRDNQNGGFHSLKCTWKFCLKKYVNNLLRPNELNQKGRQVRFFDNKEAIYCRGSRWQDRWFHTGAVVILPSHKMATTELQVNSCNGDVIESWYVSSIIQSRSEYKWLDGDINATDMNDSGSLAIR